MHEIPHPHCSALRDRRVHPQATHAEIEVFRRELLATRPLLTSRFDGEPDQFRSFHDYWCEFGDELFRKLGVDGGGEAYATTRRHAHEAAAVYPDVLPALEWLRQRGFRTGVLSDADRDHLEASIAGSGLRFDSILSSEELACYKPHRYCFEAACARLDVRPADALYVGDTPLTDIEGSRRAGLRPIWLNRRGLEWPEDLEPPDDIAESLDDLVQLLAAGTRPEGGDSAPTMT